MDIKNLGNPGGPPPVTFAPQGAPAAASVPAAPTASSAQLPSTQQVQKAMETIKQKVDLVSSNNLQFSVDDETGRTIVRVIDAQTGTTIRQIPSQELIDIAHSLDQMQKGMLLKQKA